MNPEVLNIQFGSTTFPSGAFWSQLFSLILTRIFNFQVSLPFWMQHPRSNVEFNSKSIGTNLKFFRKIKTKKVCRPFTIFNFFSRQFRASGNSTPGSSAAEKINRFGQSKIAITSRGTVFRPDTKIMLLQYIVGRCFSMTVFIDV